MAMNFRLEDGREIGAVSVPTPKAKKESHVRVLNNAVFICLHCAEVYEAAMPMAVTMYLAISKAFSKDHKPCKLDKKRGLACVHCRNFGHAYSACPNLEYKGDFKKWLAGPDVGLSSRTLGRELAGYPLVGDPDVPRDPQDFGRCYRLLKAMGWRDRIGEMAKYPNWVGLVEKWAEIEKYYEEELPSGLAPKTYDLIQACTRK